MLESLSIRNYALISQLDITFQPGFTIITGETGAGKSILLGALSLLIGQRADTTVLMDKSQKCTVEGIFNLSNYNLQLFFSDHDIDYDDHTIIRREISDAGKSRAFINDTPVNLQQLKDMGIHLIDIHSQHETIKLNLPVYQLNAIDAFAGTKNLLTRYKQVYEEYIKSIAEYHGLKAEADKSKNDLDYYQYQYGQLENAKLQEGEQSELEEEQEILSHAEEIKANLSTTEQLLISNDQSALNILKESISRMGKIIGFFSRAQVIHDRLQTSYIELKDVVSEIENLNEGVHYDPQRLQMVNERLDLLLSLLQKHNLQSLSELIVFKEQLREKIDNIAHFDTKLEELTKLIQEKKYELTDLSRQLSAERSSVIPQVEEAITLLLTQLGIPNARFKVEREAFDDFTANGLDKITFLFSANKQSNLEPVSRVASGGELSRLMLSIKSIISESIALPTIIFDELDSGISGEIADKVGVIMKRMSSRLQVINITHSPQIASRGKYHYLVYKEDVGNKTVTRIKPLKEDERIIEVAKMLSGEEVTDAAMSNARELLKN